VIEVRSGEGRARGGDAGVTTWHAFSFGAYYDPQNVGFAHLVACNEELLEPGAGFAEHPHRDTEIVTWVLDGVLEHRDDRGTTALLAAGDLQRLSAGSGVRHTERNAGPGPLRFLQMWLRPDPFGGPPEYTAVTAPLPHGPGLRLLASGAPDARPPVRLRQPAAALYAGRPDGPGACALPAAACRYLHVARGAVRLVHEDGEWLLGPGDAARITGRERVEARTEGPAEYLVWVMDTGP
jgi:redox-sensitive bicupin YhaK (pirin superfamily)